MTTTTRKILSVFFLVFLVAPAASFVVGVRASEVENRSLAPMPDVSISRLTEPGFYRELQGFFTDRLPLRDRLIQFGAGVDFWVFNSTANPDEVYRGLDRWLYLTETFDDACAIDVVPASVAEEMRRLARAIADAGKSFALVIAPDKQGVYAEYLTSDLERRGECARQKREALRAALEAQPPQGYVDTWSLLDETRRQDDRLLYFRDDSHLTTLGASIWVEAVLDQLQPDTWEPAVFHFVDTRQHYGNLTRSLGLQFTESVDHYEVRRNGLEILSAEQSGRSFGVAERSTVAYQLKQPADAVSIEGETVYLKDSFMDIPIDMLVPYHTSVTFTDWRDRGSVDLFLELLAGAEFVVIETSEHGLWKRFADSSFADSIIEALPSEGTEQ
jgi:hypothetical protein